MPFHTYFEPPFLFSVFIFVSACYTFIYPSIRLSFDTPVKFLEYSVAFHRRGGSSIHSFTHSLTCYLPHSVRQTADDDDDGCRFYSYINVRLRCSPVSCWQLHYYQFVVFFSFLLLSGHRRAHVLFIVCASVWLKFFSSRQFLPLGYLVQLLLFSFFSLAVSCGGEHFFISILEAFIMNVKLDNNKRN